MLLSEVTVIAINCNRVSRGHSASSGWIDNPCILSATYRVSQSRLAVQKAVAGEFLK
jgi:hypothetical protein